MSVSFDGVRTQFAVIGTVSNKPFNCRIKCCHAETVYARWLKIEADFYFPSDSDQKCSPAFGGTAFFVTCRFGQMLVASVLLPWS
jgi:hypothetical protein